MRRAPSLQVRHVQKPSGHHAGENRLELSGTSMASALCSGACVLDIAAALGEFGAMKAVMNHD